ncbi:protein kinase family protein [Parabacteroides sp. ZJ-118]|uniref:protein kinase family protein n=1 Tax=Parabacteroides sp. ZJ-118 TaxID=2709398 RepID=UPI0013EB92CC|nr:protein kinase family protein [Parabacteroides sp. ZJ-118]
MPLPTIPDYSTCIKTPALVHPSVLKDGHPIEKGVRLIKYSGGFCVVFPYQTPSKKYAVRCWHAEVSDAKRRTQVIADTLKKVGLPYFVGIEFYEDGIMTPQGMQPLVVMDWVEAESLKRFLSEHITEASIIGRIAENFKRMVADLHANHLSHGDLQHGNIMVKSDCSLILVDYDSMYVPNLKGMPDEIKGLVGYQHESRWKNKNVSEKADYFSELVIYTSLKALAKMPSLWADLNMEDTDTLLFSGEDIQSHGTSNIFRLLKADSELAPLVDKLCEFMAKSSIDELCPLEEAITSTGDGISAKWEKGNGYNPSAKKGRIDDSDNIAKKWAGGRSGYIKPDKVEERKNLLSSITEKFKKPQ